MVFQETFQPGPQDGRDATVYSKEPLKNFGDDESLTVKKTGTDQARSFLWFDVVPVPGYRVTAAELSFYVHDIEGTSQLFVDVHRVGESWRSDAVVWNEQPAIEGTFLSRAQNLSAGQNSFAVTEAVQAWQEASWVNHGLRVAVENHTGEGPTLHIRSSNAANESERPQLVVTYAAKEPNASRLTPRGNFDATDEAEFGWTFEHDDPDLKQEAYQLEVMRVSDSSVVYDSGKVASEETAHTLAANTLSNGEDYLWRVKTWGLDDSEGPWSDYGPFSTQDKPTVSVTSPGEGATVETSSFLLEWDFGHASEGQFAYRVVLTDQADGTIHSDTGKVASVDPQHQLQGLEDEANYVAEVTVWNDSNVASEPALRTFLVDTVPPPTPQVTAINDGEEGRLRIEITNPATGTGEEDAAHNDLYRRDPGGEWVRIAKELPLNAVFHDYTVASGDPHEYRVRTWSTVDTYADATVVGMVTLLGVWFHEPDDPEATLRHFMYDGASARSDTWEPDVELMRFAGRQRAVAEYGEHALIDQINVTIQAPSGTQDRYELDRISRLRKTMCYRDGRGRKLYVAIINRNIMDDNAGGVFQVRLEVVDYDEELAV